MILRRFDPLSCSSKRVHRNIFMHACNPFNEQDKGSNLLSIITWSVLGKQNVQAKKVYSPHKINSFLLSRILFTFIFGGQFQREMTECQGNRSRRHINFSRINKGHYIISNYWMRLSRIWRILQIKEGVQYPQRPKAEVDNTRRDLQHSSYPTKAEFNNCFVIHSKYFLLLKGVSSLRSLFFRSLNITQPCPQVFSVNDSIICGRLYFWRHWFNMAKILTSLVQ